MRLNLIWRANTLNAFSRYFYGTKPARYRRSDCLDIYCTAPGGYPDREDSHLERAAHRPLLLPTLSRGRSKRALGKRDSPAPVPSSLRVGRSRRGASARCPTHSNPPGNPQTRDRPSPFCRYPPADQSPHPTAKGAGRERSTGRWTPCRCSQIRKCSQGGRQSLPQNRPHPDVARAMRRTSVEVLNDRRENAATQRTMSR
jgi:hypothetical protein